MYSACVTEVDEKLKLVKQLQVAWEQGELICEANAELPEVLEAGHPARPELVSPRQVPRRRLGSPEGHAAMIHAIGHIEFNAINGRWTRFIAIGIYLPNTMLTGYRWRLKRFITLA